MDKNARISDYILKNYKKDPLKCREKIMREYNYNNKKFNKVLLKILPNVDLSVKDKDDKTG